MARPIAHRGLHGCGGPGPLENTLAAAEAAAVAGYGIECDVRFGRDGTPVVIHDATLARLAGRDEAVADLDAEALAAVRLRGDHPLPTLRALLAATGGRVPVVIEIKPLADPSLADGVLRQIEAYRGAVALESFDPTVVARCRRAPCPVGLVGPGTAAVDPAALPRCDFLSWEISRLDVLPGALPLTAWTVRSPLEAAAAAAARAQIVFEGWRP